MSYFTHLDCSAGCGAEPLDPQGIHHLCTCGAPLFARYDIEQAAKNWPRSSLANRAHNMWRYSEMMPLVNDDQPVTLDEGFTPLRHTLRSPWWFALFPASAHQRRGCAPSTSGQSPRRSGFSASAPVAGRHRQRNG